MPSKQCGLEDLIKPFNVSNVSNIYYTTEYNKYEGIVTIRRILAVCNVRFTRQRVLVLQRFCVIETIPVFLGINIFG